MAPTARTDVLQAFLLAAMSYLSLGVSACGGRTVSDVSADPSEGGRRDELDARGGSSDDQGPQASDAYDEPPSDAWTDGDSATPGITGDGQAPGEAGAHVDEIPDPCPSADAGPVFNCDPNCGTVTRDLCGATGGEVLVSSSATVPAVFRTPQGPGTQQSFPSCTSPVLDGVVYGLTFAFVAQPDATVVLRVAEPWEIVVGSYPHDPTGGYTSCPSFSASTFVGCAIVSPSPEADTFAYVVTKDPNAPSRNITFAYADDGGACP